MDRKPFKIPTSVLVVIHTDDLRVLLLERADRADHWQSVTGSIDTVDEPLMQTAAREVGEETAIDARTDGSLTDWHHAIEYTIYPHWRPRYAPGVTRNVEHWFGLRLPNDYPSRDRVRVAPREHLQYAWLPLADAAARCFSPSNAEAILQLPHRSMTRVIPL
ncbi:MAG: dihydroneopterin triphosphate diphosphatase [Burkholderiaceae bacterium]